MLRKILFTIPLLFALTVSIGFRAAVEKYNIKLDGVAAIAYIVNALLVTGLVVMLLVRLWFGKKGLDRLTLACCIFFIPINLLWIGTWGYDIFIQKVYPLDLPAILGLALLLVFGALNLLAIQDIRKDLRRLRYVVA